MDNEQQKKTVLRKIFGKVWDKTDSNKVINGILDKINDVADYLMFKINKVADKLNIIEIIKYDHYYKNGVNYDGVKFKINNLEYNDISAKYGGGGYLNNFLRLNTIRYNDDTIVELVNDQSNGGCFIIRSSNKQIKHRNGYIDYSEENTSTSDWTSYSINIKKLADFINTLQSTMVLSADEELTDDDKVVTIRELTQEEIDKLKQRENDIERKENE